MNLMVPILFLIVGLNSSFSRNLDSTLDIKKDDSIFVVKSSVLLNVEVSSETPEPLVSIKCHHCPCSYPKCHHCPCPHPTPTPSPGPIFKLDSSLFVIPPISNAWLDFGFLRISALRDPNLYVCGTSKRERCRKALIRTFTTGVAGPGLYNSVDRYGAPLYASQAGGSLSEVGLGAANAITLQAVTISSFKSELVLSDFPNPKYHYVSDFTDSGAGRYSTTIVVEYGLTL